MCFPSFEKYGYISLKILAGPEGSHIIINLIVVMLFRLAGNRRVTLQNNTKQNSHATQLLKFA